MKCAMMKIIPMKYVSKTKTKISTFCAYVNRAYAIRPYAKPNQQNVLNHDFNKIFKMNRIFPRHSELVSESPE